MTPRGFCIRMGWEVRKGRVSVFPSSALCFEDVVIGSRGGRGEG